MSNFNVIIDIRENKLVEQLKNLSFDFTTKSLDIGDIMITEGDLPFIIIERKTIDDLKSSVVDGRLREQRYRLLNASGLPPTRIMYIIEGDLSRRLISKERGKGGVSNSTVVGSIINMMFRDNIKVYRTNSVEETADFIIKLFSKVGDKEIFLQEKKNETEEKSEPQSYTTVVDKKKKNNMTPNVWFISQLSMIPQISNTIANAIVSVYPTLISLITSYQNTSEEERPSLLSNITYDLSTGKKRKIGMKISERVYQFIF
jgi:ERCC4-type nuclease